jgi:hypothetical protein
MSPVISSKSSGVRERPQEPHAEETANSPDYSPHWMADTFASDNVFMKQDFRGFQE